MTLSKRLISFEAPIFPRPYAVVEAQVSISPSEAVPLGFVEWILTGAATAIASGVAFMWRLMRRIDRVETSLAAQSENWEGRAAASEAAMLRLAERLAQIHDDHFRVRETMSGLPTRSDLRDLEDRVIEQLTALAARLDRVLDQ